MAPPNKPRWVKHTRWALLKDPDDRSGLNSKIRLINQSDRVLQSRRTTKPPELGRGTHGGCLVSVRSSIRQLTQREVSSSALARSWDAQRRASLAWRLLRSRSP